MLFLQVPSGFLLAFYFALHFFSPGAAKLDTSDARYNIVSGRDLKDAARKLENYLALLRRPRLWKTVEFKVGDNVLRAVVPTKAGAGAVAADNAVPPEMRRPGQLAR